MTRDALNCNLSTLFEQKLFAAVNKRTENTLNVIDVSDISYVLNADWPMHQLATLLMNTRHLTEYLV